MPIITKPGSIQKNVSASITLNKSVLAVNSIVAADTYFSDSSNWNQVIINYKSPIGNQKESLIFDASLASPTASFLVSLKARDTFEVQDIVITDFDGGFLKVERANLTTTDFDISFQNSSLEYVNWNLKASSSVITETDGGLYVNSEIPYKNGTCKSSLMALVGDFTLEYKVNGSNFWETVFGVSSNLDLPTPVTHLQGSWALLNWHTGHFDWTDSTDNIIEKNFPASEGVEYSIKFQRIGNTITVKINDTLFESFNYSGTLYPVARTYKVGQAILYAAKIA